VRGSIPEGMKVISGSESIYLESWNYIAGDLGLVGRILANRLLLTQDRFGRQLASGLPGGPALLKTSKSCGFPEAFCEKEVSRYSPFRE